MNTLKPIFQVASTFFLVEFRSLSSLMVSGLYLIVSLFIFAMALPKAIVPPEYANAGVLWTTIFLSTSSLASFLFIARSQQEWTQSLLLSGVTPIQIYLARWLLLFVFMLFMVSVATPILIVFSDTVFPQTFLPMFAMTFVTCASYASLAVLFSSLMAKEKFTELLMPVLILPLSVPLLILCVRGTTQMFLGDMPQGLFFLLGYTLVMFPCSTLLSEYVIEME